MFTDLPFMRRRVEQLTNFSALHQVDFTAETFAEVLDFVLADQQENGGFSGEGRNYDVVKTAVVLQSLSSFGFTANERWECIRGDSSSSRGVNAAIQFLNVSLTENKTAISGDDLWDHCQVLLAFAAFNMKNEVQERATNLVANWRGILKQYESGSWFGAAFHCAVVDVCGAFCASNAPPADEIVKEVLALQEPDGFFRGKSQSKALQLWNTSLALRTLCRVEGCEFEPISKAATWVIKQLANNELGDSDGDKPMYLARALEGLIGVRNRKDISRSFRSQLDDILRRGLSELSKYWLACKNQQIGTPKAYTAVIQFFSQFRIEVNVPMIWLAEVALKQQKQGANGELVPYDIPDGLKIAWLSDIHESTLPNFPWYSFQKKSLAKLMLYGNSETSETFPFQNLKVILSRVRTISPKHILVTGDLTNLGTAEQFGSVRREFLQLQGDLGVRRNQLDADLWTVIPGNHDVSKGQRTWRVRNHFGNFWEHFGELFGPNLPQQGGADPFPFVRTLNTKGEQQVVRLLCLDTNNSWSPYVLNKNPVGFLDGQQLSSLRGSLARRSDFECDFVVMHHHPVTVPVVISDLENKYLAMTQRDSEKLIALCVSNNVRAILHGHFHTYSEWSVPVPGKDRRMSIVGAPCGTVSPPGQNVRFLELRESLFSGLQGLEHGMAVHEHLLSGTEWKVEYKCFLRF